MIIKVAAKSEPKRVAGSIAKALRERPMVEVRAVGAGAVNQAVKALAVASIYLSADGSTLVASPRFVTLTVNNQAYTGISFQVRAVSNRDKPGSKKSAIHKWGLKP